MRARGANLRDARWKIALCVVGRYSSAQSPGSRPQRAAEATNEPTQEALRTAVRTVLDRPAYRMRASQMADEFARIDTRSEILSLISEVVAYHKAGQRAETMATSQPRRTAQQR
jgi:hypothetical protein